MFVAVNFIALNEKNEILLARRSKNEDMEPGKWGLPGGGVEEGETLEQAIRREYKEETNCEIIELNFFKSRYLNSTLAVYFYGKINGEIKLNEENEEHGWFSEEEIKGLDLAFKQKEVLEEFFKKI
jgi:8-oxo-dGTP diphosphatase